MSVRSGIGWDSHRLEAGRRLVLGGVELGHDTGLVGHSDADVLTHAVMDALLGAAACGDIGQWFPDTDERFKDADFAGGMCITSFFPVVGLAAYIFAALLPGTKGPNQFGAEPVGTGI